MCSHSALRVTNILEPVETHSESLNSGLQKHWYSNNYEVGVLDDGPSGGELVVDPIKVVAACARRIISLPLH
jgi:hypothetical protein